MEIILSRDDEELPPLPDGGETLLGAMTRLPALAPLLGTLGITSQMVRANIIALRQNDQRMQEIQIIIQPGQAELRERFLKNCNLEQWSPPGVVTPIGEAATRITVKLTNANEEPARFMLCDGCTLEEDRLALWTETSPLNEFGWYYIALFIAGNYARYYPDKWVDDVERNSPLSLAIEELLRTAAERVPLLLLSELSRTYLVPEK